MTHHAPSSNPQPVSGPAASPAGRLVLDADKPTAQTIRETIESIAVAFILAFVFRAFVVEAFVIPTSSMAPTLLGRHIRLIDPYTGQRFAVDSGEYGSALSVSRPTQVSGLMSGYRWDVPIGTRLSPGDRILVLKYPYAFSEPQRWDVVVFRNPSLPGQNFIKRLVGLPGEQVLLIDGDVYIKPAADQPWSIARKTDHRRADKVQRAVWQPIFHSRWTPPVGGPPADTQQAGPWRAPWRIIDGQWATDAYGLLDTTHGYILRGERGLLRFDFDQIRGHSPGLYPYNQVRAPNRELDQPVEDVRLAVRVEPQADHPTVRLTTTARLDDPQGRPRRLSAVLDGQGRLQLMAGDGASGDLQPLAGPVDVGPWRAGVPRHLELWLVDLEASVHVDGRRMLVHRFELPFQMARARPPAPRDPAELSIALDGGPAVLRDIELDRDLYYGAAMLFSGAPTESGMHPNPGHGVLFKQGDDVWGEPFPIEADQFYCLGDNSPLSGDSRLWEMVDPWVRSEMLADDPTPVGVVPRELMMGRAFFVYWPAPFALGPDKPALIPNFADMRFIH